MHAIDVRQADLRDAADQQAILDLLESYAQDEMGGGAGLRPDVKERLIPQLQSHPTTRVHLAFSGTHAVGIAVCFLGFSTFAAKSLLNVHDLAVLPGHRGCGVGKRLLAAVADDAITLGCCKITLEVRCDNRAARKLYESEGFRGCGPGAAFDSMWFLEKTLV